MIYKPYGNTGKMVSAIGFGGMRFRDNYSLEEAAEVVTYANSLGINYFDTAPHYCGDRSEDIFGYAFKHMPNDFYVSTKSSVNDDPDESAVRRRIENSLKRLGLEKINFYHMWCIMDLDHYKRVIAPNGPYYGALKAKEEGLIDHIVFSTHACGADIRTMIEDGYFEGVTLGYNIVNFPFRQEGILAAHEHGLGVATMNPLGGGLIPNNKDYFSFIKSREDESVVQAALRFNASHESISVTLSGMGTKEEVKHNVDTIKNLNILNNADIDILKTSLRKDMNALCTTCQYCTHCPKNINIPKYMEIYNHYILKGIDGAKARFKECFEDGDFDFNIDMKPSDCIKCKKCETLCTQKLDIIERLKWLQENILDTMI